MNKRTFNKYHDETEPFNAPEKAVTNIHCDCGNTLMLADIKYRFAPVALDGHILPYGKWKRDESYTKQTYIGPVLFCPRCGKEYYRKFDICYDCVRTTKKDETTVDEYCERVNITRDIINSLKKEKPDSELNIKLPAAAVHEIIHRLSEYIDVLNASL